MITAAGERLYAWDGAARRCPGWPVRPDPARANCAPSEQQKETQASEVRLPRHARGCAARGPGKPLAIVVARPRRAPVCLPPRRHARARLPGAADRPDLPADERMTAESINNPAIGDLDGDGRDDIVVATNEVYGGSAAAAAT